MIHRITSRKTEVSESLKGLVSISSIIIIISCIIALTGFAAWFWANRIHPQTNKPGNLFKQRQLSCLPAVSIPLTRVSKTGI